MKINDDKFYVLEVGEEKWIHDLEATAIKSMKEFISKTADANPENVSILEVNTNEKK